MLFLKNLYNSFSTTWRIIFWIDTFFVSVVLIFFIWINIPQANAEINGTCTFAPASSSSAWAYSAHSSCVFSGITYDFGQVLTNNYSSLQASNTGANNFQTLTSTNYWSSTCRFTTTTKMWTSNSGVYTTLCSLDLINFPTKWSPWEKWATGSIWHTGATGIWLQWPPWLDVYEVAQIMGFTWSIAEYLESLKWPTWATWTIDFSSLSWTISLQNVVNLPSETTLTWFLDSAWSYMPLTQNIDWVNYIHFPSLIYLALALLFLSGVFWFVWWFVSYVLWFKKR